MDSLNLIQNMIYYVHEDHNFVENFDYNFKKLDSKKGLSICLYNVNGLRSKLDDIKVFLIDLTIPNYNFHRKDRNRHGGGVGIYCKDFVMKELNLCGLNLY